MIPRLGKTSLSALILGTAIAGAPYGNAPAADDDFFVGRVYIDANADGRPDPTEAGAAGIRVSNGREVATTDADGRYQLPKRQGFVALSRPRGFHAPSWYARGSADFALVPASDPEDFFFVQVSDSHVYERVQHFQEFSTPDLPSWIPQLGVDWATLWLLDRVYGDGYPEGVGAGMRRALVQLAAKQPASSQHDERIREIEDLGDIDTLRAYTAELERPGSPLGDVGGFARRAFEEVAALEPDFIVNTGDLVLEGNSGSAEAVSEWFEFYDSITQSLPVPVYNTIGNNEIAGNQNGNFQPDHPAYGKRSFEANYGPSHYSFARGPFHFIGLDTHRPDPTDDEPEWWSYGAMEPHVRDWLEADLSASAGSTAVVLNHEPFHIDPEWPLGDLEAADDAGLFAKFGVPYVLSGHTHFNSFIRTGSITHIGTGALSGMRWILPPDVHPRGYRLFWARANGTLHSAWKQSGRPLIALAEGGPGAVVVAADVSQPFGQLEIRRGSQVLQTRAWGDYFIQLVDDRPGPIIVRATSADGRSIEQTLNLP